MEGVVEKERELIVEVRSERLRKRKKEAGV